MSSSDKGAGAHEREVGTSETDALELLSVPEQTAPRQRRRYITVPFKLAIALVLGTLWMVFSLYFAIPWFGELSRDFSTAAALFIVLGVALIPGMVNAFLIAGLMLDRRPSFDTPGVPPPVTILIAAFNEEDCIRETLEALARQRYEAALEILVIDDGSTDRTREVVREVMAEGGHPPLHTVKLLEMPRNGGKARALTAGLHQASHDLIITIDADTMVFGDAILHLVANQLASPAGTAATAGTVLVRNSRRNLMTRLQEWDYFLGIAVVKRVQSLLQGTLVAQGAFSIYRREVLLEVGGWPHTVGEDIVLTWAMLERGYRVGYAENAFVFTNVPETFPSYYRQRKRWSRGLIEAFKRHPDLLLPRRRLYAPFIYHNLMFPLLDAAYLFAFLPGVLAALLLHNYAIVGLMTLLVLPLAVLVNVMMFFKQRAIFQRHGLVVRRNILGAVIFTLAYQAVLAPASLAGYLSELAGMRKKW